MDSNVKIRNHGYTRTTLNGNPIHDIKWALRSNGKEAGVVVSETPGDSHFIKIDDINELFLQDNSNDSLEKRLKILHKKTKKRKRKRKRRKTARRKTMLY